MVAIQILSKILLTADNSIVEDNMLSVDYFVGYEDEYEFIQEHLKKYGNVPDTATFLSKFPDMEIVDVQESDRYLVDTIREEHLYHKSVPIIQKAAELLKADSNAAAEYLIHSLRELRPDYGLGGVDIIADSQQRFEEFVERKEHKERWFFTSGFPELDELIYGIQRQDELFVIFARTNQGKSWVLEKICTHVWQIGHSVGYISPEMSASSIGYRFDTLHSNFSNSGLMWGKDVIDEEEYQRHIQGLKNTSNKFMVATPADFDKKITVSKLKKWIEQHKLDMIAIDGITYMTDERSKRGDNKTTSLTNISEDLMELSMEMKVPVLVVVQANRGGVIEKGSTETPELENIRDSDGIAHNASKILSLRQISPGVIVFIVKKQRMGPVGGKLIYNWDIDRGLFNFIPSYEDAQPEEETVKRVAEVKSQYKDKSDVF